MTRFPPLSEAALSDEQRALARLVCTGKVWPGPYNALARLPAVGLGLHALVTALKSGPLPAAVQEVAVLTVAAGCRCQYGWHAHVPLALAAGVDSAGLARIGKGLDPAFSAATLQGTWMVAAQLLADSLDPPRLGTPALDDETDLIGLTALVGAYWLIFKLVDLDQPSPRPSIIPLDRCPPSLGSRHVRRDIDLR